MSLGSRCLLIVLAAIQSVRSAQPIHMDPYTDYRNVVDRLFFVQPNKGRPPRLTIALLFLPSFQPEEEILLRIEADGRSEVTLLSARESIWKRFSEAKQKHASLSIRDLGLTITRTDYKATSRQVKEWAQILASAAGENLKSIQGEIFADTAITPSVIVDGITYGLTFQTAEGRVVVEFSDADGPVANEKHRPAIVKAMNTIRHSIDAIKPDHP